MISPRFMLLYHFSFNSTRINSKYVIKIFTSMQYERKDVAVNETHNVLLTSWFRKLWWRHKNALIGIYRNVLPFLAWHDLDILKVRVMRDLQGASTYVCSFSNLIMRYCGQMSALLFFRARIKSIQWEWFYIISLFFFFSIASSVMRIVTSFHLASRLLDRLRSVAWWSSGVTPEDLIWPQLGAPPLRSLFFHLLCHHQTLQVHQ